jgi:DNA repair exonuclease SbcCD ATPase subunit
MAQADISKDQERLAKLWDAYEIQERELELSMKKIATLEHKLEEMNRVNGVLKKSMEDRDKEIRDIELKLVTLEEQNSKYEPRLNELDRMYLEEKERYSKLFSITEELEEELERAKTESEIKDKWFERNVGMLENLKESIVERNVELHKAAESGPKTKLESDEKVKFRESIAPPKSASEQVPETKPSFESLTKDPEPETDTGEIKKDETDEAVTFKKVSIEEDTVIKEEPPSETTTESTFTTETTETSKNETIYEFTKIPNVDPLVAESLYNGGFTSIEKLKSATTEDLAIIDGVSPTLARKIRTNLFEMGE